MAVMENMCGSNKEKYTVLSDEEWEQCADHCINHIGTDAVKRQKNTKKEKGVHFSP